MATPEAEEKIALKKPNEKPPDVKPITPNQVLRSSKGMEYVVERRLGAGGFGEVWKVAELHDPEKTFAMKTERNSNSSAMKKMMRLKVEVNLFEEIARSSSRIDKSHFVKMHDKGKTADFKYMIMDLIWMSLTDIRFKICGGAFTPHTKIKVARQTLKAIEALHEIGYIHRDIKADNIAVGLPPRDTIVYLLDFGIARPYRDDNGNVKVARKKVPWMGTMRYASIEGLYQNEQSMRDDLEVWLYVILELYDPINIQWSFLENEETDLHITHRKELIGQCREMHAANRLRAPIKWCDIIEIVDGMDYEDKCEFQQINLILSKICADENIDENLPFDWAGKKPKSPEKPKKKKDEKKVGSKEVVNEEKKEDKKEEKKEEKKVEKREEKKEVEKDDKKEAKREDKKDRKPRTPRQTEDNDSDRETEDNTEDEYRKYLKWKKIKDKKKTREVKSDRDLPRARGGNKASAMKRSEVKKGSKFSKASKASQVDRTEMDEEGTTEVSCKEMKFVEKKEVKRDAEKPPPPVIPNALIRRSRTRQDRGRNDRLGHRKMSSAENVKKKTKVSKISVKQEEKANEVKNDKDKRNAPVKKKDKSDSNESVDDKDNEKGHKKRGNKPEANETREERDEKDGKRKNRVRKRETNEKDKLKGRKKSSNEKTVDQTVEEKEKVEKKNDKINK